MSDYWAMADVKRSHYIFAAIVVIVGAIAIALRIWAALPPKGRPSPVIAAPAPIAIPPSPPATAPSMPAGVREIIPAHRDSYEFPPCVIRSQSQLDEVIAKQSNKKASLTPGGKRTWPIPPPDHFINAVTEAKIDFDREAIVIVGHGEGSGSYRVVYQPPRIVDGIMIVDIVITGRGGPGTADFAYYFAVYAVDVTCVKKVEVRDNGGLQQFLKISPE